MRIETIAVHAGHEVDEAWGAISPPIVLSTTFERAGDGSFPHGYIYARSGNPNRDALEHCIAALEGGVSAAAFSSGSAATMGIFNALKHGDHVLAPRDVYYGTRLILNELCASWGLKVNFVDMTDLNQVEESIKPETKLLWIETPSNPLLKITDIKAVSNIAHSAGARCVCDNTWATPVLQRPLELGADIVLHSTTKYFGGHSDVVEGCVVSNSDDEFFQRVCSYQKIGGAVPSPFECWLLLRSIPTLPYRMRIHSENALRIAKFLRDNHRVLTVHYPGLRDNPGYKIASRQMEQFGGMLSFEVRGGEKEAFEVAARVKIIRRATSLGCVESLIEHRASIEGKDTSTPPNLLRLSVGIENPEDLIEDLSKALG